MSWPLVELKDVAPSKPIKNPEILNEENTWQLNLDKIESGSGVITEKVYGSVQSAGSSTHWFDKRHVLYSKLRPYLNKVVLPDMQGLATTELVPLCPDPSRLDRKFLAYYLRSSRFVNWISDQVAGAKMPRVSMKVFWEHKIPLPPLAEQKRIAAILDKADGIRRKRQQAIDLADEFLRSVFLDMFGDPVTNPKGWEVQTIDSVTFDWKGGAPFKPANFTEEGINVLHKGAVQKNDKILIDNRKKTYTTPEFAEKYKKSEVNNSYLAITLRDLVPTGPSIGLISNLKGSVASKYILAQGAYGVRCKRQYVSPSFLIYLSNNRSFRSRLSKYWVGSTQIHIRTPIFKSILIPIPPIELQESFELIATKYKAKMDKCLGEKVQLEALFYSLSQKAFAGQL